VWDREVAMGTSYSRRILVPSPGSNAFPQADSLSRLLDVLAAACHSPKLDEEVLAQQFSITPRQGAYYHSAAAYVGLTYKRGGWIKPTPEGERINAISDETGRRMAVFDVILTLPVFGDAARHAATTGELPRACDVTSWVRMEDHKVNETTATRRAETVLAWIGLILKEAPAALEAMAPAPMMAMA
jgi:hypothetical protein